MINKMRKIILVAGALSAMQMVSAAEVEESWSLFMGPDGKVWSAATVAHKVDMGNEYYSDWFFHTMEVTVSDASHQVVGGFTVDVSDWRVNSLEVFGPVTQHLFNADDEYELGVDIHMPGNAENNYTGKNIFRAYNLKGEMLFEAEGVAEIVAAGEQSSLILSKSDGNSFNSNLTLDIYQSAEQGFAKAHTFEMSTGNVEYLSSSVISAKQLSDGLHYLLAYYEKPLPQLDEDGQLDIDPITWMPYWTPDNHLVIENYNANFELVDQIKLPTDCPEGIYSRMMGIGSATDCDLTEGYFTGDSRYNYMVFCDDMDGSWESTYTFEVYAQGGEHVGILCSGVESFWNHLADIPGENDQWLFLKGGNNGPYLSIVETPTFSEVKTIPAVLHGRNISTNMDRMKDSEDGYKYVIGLNEGDMDAAGNVVALYGIYDKDLAQADYVRFVLNPNVEAFQPLVDYSTLDPHLFNTDDQHEFIFMTKESAPNNAYLTNLYVGNESGEILRCFGDEGDIYTAAILNYGTDQPELFVNYMDQETMEGRIEFYSLPLNAVGIKQLKTSAQGMPVYNLMGVAVKDSHRGIKVRGGRVVCE